MTPVMQRRDFFRPASLARAAAESAGHVLGRLEPTADHEHPLVRLTRSAMACMFEVQISITEPNRQAAVQAFELVDRLEDQLSVYRADSEISFINQAAFDKAVPVEPRLFALLLRCQHLWQETDGAFDITCGPLIRAWGFFRRQGRVPSKDELEECRRCVGFNKVKLDVADNTIRFSRPGVEINLGAVGKGFVLDRVAEGLHEAGLDRALLSAGHSSIRALGAPRWDCAWRLALADPRDRTRTVAHVGLRDQALSTSGSTEQSFVESGRRYSHLLDPRTGQPAEVVTQVSVVAPDATLAEALSTAFFVLGPEWAAHYCEKHQRTGALFVLPSSTSQTNQVRRIGSIDVQLPRSAAALDR
jgi:thiamine biosynthesis lipoprotein